MHLKICENGVLTDLTDCFFSWPIFFYGTHEHLWISECDLRPFEENRLALGKLCTKKRFKEAMVEAFTSPMVEFQFKGQTQEDEQKMRNWLHGKTEQVENLTQLRNSFEIIFIYFKLISKEYLLSYPSLIKLMNWYL